MRSAVRSVLLAAIAPCLARAVYYPGASFSRFVTIWLENEDFSKVDVNPDIAELAKQGILLTSYYGVTHPSQPNYIASVGGDYFGLNHDGFVKVPVNVSTLVDLLDYKSISWKEYLEDVPGPGYMGPGYPNEDGQLEYVRKHNPLISFDSVAMNGSRLLNIVSLDKFHKDLEREDLPQYAHISPNMLNDGHDTSLAYAANWTRSFLMPLLKNPYFMERTLVLLTYDESETYGKPNKIGSLLLGGAIPEELKGTKDDTFYNHYSILSTLECNWELPNLGRYDVGANVFDFVAKDSYYVNRDVDRSKVDLSVSYAGALNDKQFAPIPPPNPYLIGAGQRGIIQDMPDAWRTPQGGKVVTPYDGSVHIYDGAKSPPVYQTLSAKSQATAAPMFDSPHDAMDMDNPMSLTRKRSAARALDSWSAAIIGWTATSSIIFVAWLMF